MATYCVFDLSGMMEQQVCVGGPPLQSARDYFKDTVPASHRVGIYESQEMLPASKLGIVCGAARLTGEDTFQIDSTEMLEAKASHHALLFAEQKVIELSGTILVMEEALKAFGSWARPQFHKALEDRGLERERLMRLIRGEMAPDLHIDPNLMRIAGETFHIRLDPILAPGR